MDVPSKRWKYMLPRAENMLYVVMHTIIGNLAKGNPAKVDMVPLVERAYTIVNEVGVIPYQEYDADTTFREQQ
jgi:hypothetical protein